MEANESRFRSYLNEFKSYSKNINWFNFALISVFSVSSWVCTNGKNIICILIIIRDYKIYYFLDKFIFQYSKHLVILRS